jgi:hypothetical protein
VNLDAWRADAKQFVKAKPIHDLIDLLADNACHWDIPRSKSQGQVESFMTEFAMMAVTEWGSVRRHQANFDAAKPFLKTQDVAVVEPIGSAPGIAPIIEIQKPGNDLARLAIKLARTHIGAPSYNLVAGVLNHALGTEYTVDSLTQMK